MHRKGADPGEGVPRGVVAAIGDAPVLDVSDLVEVRRGRDSQQHDACQTAGRWSEQATAWPGGGGEERTQRNHGRDYERDERRGQGLHRGHHAEAAEARPDQVGGVDAAHSGREVRHQQCDADSAEEERDREQPVGETQGQEALDGELLDRAYLEERGVPHVAYVFPGGHKWSAWRPALEQVLRVQLSR